MDVIILLAVITFFLALAALIVSCQKKSGSEGPPGQEGQEGPRGNPGTGIVATNIQYTTIDENIFSQLSPDSNLSIPANSIKIGDVFRLKTSGQIESKGSSSLINIQLGLISGSQLLNIIFDDHILSPSFTISADITFMTLTTVMMNASLLLDFGTFVSEIVFTTYRNSNIAFDSTVDQTFILSGDQNGAVSSTVTQAMLTHLIS